ncbi:DUF3471 domain-containing protein [Mucilaginibacter sp. UR6-11]|uniref:DUF3471 domain-containing protein n=1 Tax=Mucilaginibacter sp. UR6-11 TaxID=1435644 RepID=UPI001E644C6F|nr:DUF3471 domain-containing protein [Mucilaginibacter sp. UR6-11]MCC8424996.1 DUF3471 domain-containing protein [Mucilaginibacter sp. UR6-11]
MTKIRLTPYIDQSAALGVFIDNRDRTKYFQHSGVDEGFITQYYGSLEDGNGLIIMINTSNGTIIQEIVNSIAKVYEFKGLYYSKQYKVVSLSDDVLQAYTGRYQMGPGLVLTILTEDHHVFAQLGRQKKIELFAEGNNKFFSKEPNVEIEFIRNNKGEIVKLLVNEDGVHEGQKIK